MTISWFRHVKILVNTLSEHQELKGPQNQHLMEFPSTSADRTVEASAEELASWELYKKESKITKIPIPYAFVLGGVNVAGVLYLEDPVENSSTDGAAVGAIVGIYHLDQSHATVRLYDPTNNILRLELALSIKDGTLNARLCNRKWNGRWNCSGWKTVASW